MAKKLILCDVACSLLSATPEGNTMIRPQPADAADDLRIGWAAMRNQCCQAFSTALLAFALILFRKDWEIVLGVFILWAGLWVIYDRWSLGSDWKAKQRAQREYIRGLGPVPFLVGFFIPTVTFAFRDFVRGEPWSPFGSPFLFALAGAYLGQACAAWCRLRSPPKLKNADHDVG